MDDGPWKAMRVVTKTCGGNKTTGYEVCSEDFAHDVSLEITGDFEDIEQLRKYAEWLAEQLNGLPQEDKP